MSEKRKAHLTILLRYNGKAKSNKLELFEATQFNDKAHLERGAKLYRLRVNGKWYDKLSDKQFYTKWEIRDLLIRSIKI